MNGLDQIDEEDTGTVFRDVMMLVLFGFMTIVILLLPHLNPPTKTAEDLLPPGNVIVELRWPDEIDSDVDLWVQAPGDVPVGYSNKGGEVFNLLRDDLGHSRDAAEVNYEVAFSRGRPAGEYTINLHLYKNNAKVLPVPAKIVVSMKSDAQAPMRKLAERAIDLTHLGEETTVLRFSLGEEGRLVPGSLHDLPKLLRSRATSG